MHGGEKPASTAGRGEKRGKKVSHALLQMLLCSPAANDYCKYFNTGSVSRFGASALAHLLRVLFRIMSLSNLISDHINTLQGKRGKLDLGDFTEDAEEVRLCAVVHRHQFTLLQPKLAACR